MKTEDRNDLENMILESISISIPNKLSSSKSRKKNTARCSIHKYIRFRGNNKTYRKDIYYCTHCPSTIPIASILGRETLCWKCNQSFTVSVGYTPNKPLCNTCRGKSKETTINLMSLIDERLK